MNNRIIKFRAWNKELKLFVTGQIPLFFNKDLNKTSGENKCLIFQQFTGLLDKNKKEIYEGDILSFGSYRVQVKWDKTWTCFDFVDEKWSYHCNGPCMWENFEIIGNIFENPELLK